jgi:hypothetical protein
MKRAVGTGYGGAVHNQPLHHPANPSRRRTPIGIIRGDHQLVLSSLVHHLFLHCEEAARAVGPHALSTTPCRSSVDISSTVDSSPSALILLVCAPGGEHVEGDGGGPGLLPGAERLAGERLEVLSEAPL